jgi:hypothetical protein
MRNSDLIIILTTMLFSCNSKPETTAKIIERSINFHDPEKEWASLDATFNFNSSFSFNDSIPEEMNITMDILKNNFTYKNIDRKVEIQYSTDSCKLLSKNGSCDGYAWTKNFYTYIWGLPMKLKDPKVKPLSNWKLDTINNYPC